MERTGFDLQKIDNKTVSELALQQAQNLWDHLIDCDPFYNKSSFMISCQLKDVDSVIFFMQDLPEVFDLNYNLRDHKKRSGFILACRETEDLDEDPQEETNLDIEQASVKKELNLIQRLNVWLCGEEDNDDQDDQDEQDKQDDQDDENEEDIEPRKKVLKLFLEHAERLKIDLTCKDDQGKSGFNYLPEDWIEEFRTEYPQHFQS